MAGINCILEKSFLHALMPAIATFTKQEGGATNYYDFRSACSADVKILKYVTLH